MKQKLNKIIKFVEKPCTKIFDQEGTMKFYRRTQPICFLLSGIYMAYFVTSWFPVLKEFTDEIDPEGNDQLFSCLFLLLLFVFVIAVNPSFPPRKIMRRMKNIYGAKRTRYILDYIALKQLIITPIFITIGIVLCHWTGIEDPTITSILNTNNWDEIVTYFLSTCCYYTMCNWLSLNVEKKHI